MRAELRRDAALGQPAADEATAGLAAREPDRGFNRWLTRLLAAGRCYADGPSAALDTLVAEAGTERADVDRREPATLLAIGCYRMLCGELGAAITDLSELIASPDDSLPPETEVRGRQWLALAYQLAGAWREADHQAKSAIATVHSTDARSSGAPHAISAILAAYRGEQAGAEEQLRYARDLADSFRPDDAVLADVADVTIAHSCAALHLGRPALQRLAKGGDAARKYRALWLPLLAETLVEQGEEPAASAALAELLALADRVPYLRLTWFRLSGRVQERRRDPVAAGRLYQAAKELPPECFEVPLQGWTRGALPRTAAVRTRRQRSRRGPGSTKPLPASRRQRERYLTPAGPKPTLSARRRTLSTEPRHSILTKRERAVARLVAAGLTNQETAARLYITVKTVEYHLAQIYSKLGISSRRQLARFASTTSELDDDFPG